MELRCISENFTLIVNGEGGTVGREGSIGADFFHDKKYVSRKHAIITFKDEKYSIVDLTLPMSKGRGFLGD